MGTFIQFLIIAGLCAGLGALFHRTDFRVGAKFGFAVGLVVALIVYGIESAVISQREFDASAEQGRQIMQERAKELGDMYARDELQRERERALAKTDPDFKIIYEARQKYEASQRVHTDPKEMTPYELYQHGLGPQPQSDYP